MKTIKIVTKDSKSFQDLAAFVIAGLAVTATLFPERNTITVPEEAHDSVRDWLDMEQIAAVVTLITWSDDEEREKVLDNPTTDAATIREITIQKVCELKEEVKKLSAENETLSADLKKSQDSASVRYDMWMREEREKLRLLDALNAVSTVISLVSPTPKSN